jgi:hypothetical protein
MIAAVEVNINSTYKAVLLAVCRLKGPVDAPLEAKA